MLTVLRRNSYPTQAGGGGYQARRPNPYAQQDGAYEMSEVKDSSAYNGGGTGDDMSAFYAEVSILQSDPRLFLTVFIILQDILLAR